MSGITYHICAIDGGGTGCRAAIAHPDGTVLARASGGPANYTTNPAQACANVLNAVSQAVEQLGKDAPPLEAMVAHIGLAGIMNAQDAKTMAANLPFKSCTVSDDRLTSAIGALGRRDGVLLAIGTGSFAAVRRSEDIRFFGGWGLSVGDQASGAWLGRAVLEHSLLAEEGLVAASDLTRLIMARFDDLPANVASFAGRASPAEFATFAPFVISAAKDGDVVGVTLMTRGTAYLNAVLKAANIRDTAPICLIGGVGPHYEAFLAPEHRARIQAPEGTALDGALQLARKTLKDLEAQS
ncbi:BadF/BadG/BcrA/BcrD ATPase family protein [Primorskyibacter sp. 2E233]|uniref:BadF/BadG/BcrA/BcrD ATPase family protein n=1 Tax=Primorskyibacter sp. 2E233 TaxID=3413431 RepID=UPI003BF2A315